MITAVSISIGVYYRQKKWHRLDSNTRGLSTVIFNHGAFGSFRLNGLDYSVLDLFGFWIITKKLFRVNFGLYRFENRIIRFGFRYYSVLCIEPKWLIFGYYVKVIFNYFWILFCFFVFCLFNCIRLVWLFFLFGNIKWTQTKF